MINVYEKIDCVKIRMVSITYFNGIKFRKAITSIFVETVYTYVF